MKKIKKVVSDFIDTIKKARGSRTEWLTKCEKILFVLVMILLSVFIIIISKGLVWGIVFSVFLSFCSIVSFLGGYRYLTSESKIVFLDILTAICLICLILVYLVPVLCLEIIIRLTQKVNLRYLSRNIELFFLLIILSTIFAMLVYVTSQYYSKEPLLAKISYIIVLIVFNIVKSGLVYLTAIGRNKAYIRYKINQELTYVGEFLVSLFLLIRQFLPGEDIELMLSVFLIISAITAIKSGLVKFIENTKQTNCLNKILMDLENCSDYLASLDPQTEVRVRFLIDTNFLGIFYRNGRKKVKKAIRSICVLAYSEESIPEKKQSNEYIPRVFHRHTYNCTVSELQIQIKKVLNEIVKALQKPLLYYICALLLIIGFTLFAFGVALA